MEDNAKIIDKIAKVLAKASNNPSEAECQSAIALAQELMAKYNIEMSDIEGMSRMKRQKRQVTQEGTLRQKRYEWWMKNLVPIIANNFRCKGYLNVGFDSWRSAMFVGFKEDVAIANLAFTQTVDVIWFLQRKYFLKIRREIKKNTGIKLTSWQLKSRVNTYIAGFLKGLKDKLEEQRTSNVYALVLVTPQEVEDEYKLMKLHKGEKSSAAMAPDAEAFDTGYKDGQKHTIIHGFIKNGDDIKEGDRVHFTEDGPQRNIRILPTDVMGGMYHTSVGLQECTTKSTGLQMCSGSKCPACDAGLPVYTIETVKDKETGGLIIVRRSVENE